MVFEYTPAIFAHRCSSWPPDKYPQLQQDPSFAFTTPFAELLLYSSLFQTGMINSLTGKTLFICHPMSLSNDCSNNYQPPPPKPNSVVSDTEGNPVTWYTRPCCGRRVIHSGTITGVTFVKTSDCV